jgi:hypothetical protein
MTVARYLSYRDYEQMTRTRVPQMIKELQARTAEIHQLDFGSGFRVDRRAESLLAPLPP